MFVKKEPLDVNVPEGTEIDTDVPKNLTEAKDKYVADNMRDLLFNMKATKVPKGVWMSTIAMSTPLALCCGHLALMAPFSVNSAMVDPATFAYTARTAVRLLSLNVAFFGGIHYGLATATWDTARNEEEKK